LLRHADALLTHGGMNSVLEALTWGVPMVLRPRIREQRRTAAKVVDLGVGMRATRGRRLRDQVELLAGDDSVRARAQALRERMRTVSGAPCAADELLRLADLDTRC
jgi:UDP:flavonoid glycosyltransferase YjiC (YdhE family)